MNFNITGQYKYIAKEQEKLRKMIKNNDQKILLFKKYLEHTGAVKKSREEIRAGKIFTLQEVEKKLGLK